MKYLILTLSAIVLIACKSEGESTPINSSEENNSTELFIERTSEETNLSFKNTVIETENENYESFPFIYNGAGVAVGDLNNDGLAVFPAK